MLSTICFSIKIIQFPGTYYLLPIFSFYFLLFGYAMSLIFSKIPSNLSLLLIDIYFPFYPLSALSIYSSVYSIVKLFNLSLTLLVEGREMVQILLSAGADQTAQDAQHGRTALHTAAMANDVELVKVCKILLL